MVKEKPNSIRIYDSEGYRRRAACICVKNDLEDEVLLVTSSRRPDNWIVPGGGVEPEEEPAVTALREVREEAGVLGQLGRCLGVFENVEHKHRTQVWVMRVTEELPEWEDSRAIGRKRKWFSIPEALVQLAQHKPVQRTLEEMEEEVMDGIQQGEDEDSDSVDEESMEEINEEDEEKDVNGDVKTEKKVYLPGQALKKGEELVVDKSAYRMLHQAQTGAPCLSFDVIRDDYGNSRENYPMSMYLVAGTQAAQTHVNNLIVMKMSNLIGTGRREDDSDDESSDSDNDEDETKTPVMTVATIKHQGCVNRIRCTQVRGTTLAASWSELGRVNIWSLDEQLRALEDNALLASYRKKSEKGEGASTPLMTFKGHLSEGFALDWCQTEAGTLASGDCKGNIHIWRNSDGGTGDFSLHVDQRPYNSHAPQSVEDLQWSPNERNVLASCSVDKSIRIWDTRANPQSACMLTASEAHTSDVNVISWNRKETRFLVSGGDDGMLRIWDLRQFGSNGGTAVATFKQHTAPVTTVEWHPEEATVFASGGADDQIAQWDLSVEVDQSDASQNDELSGLPPQLLFIHQGQTDVKELHWHPQCPGTLISTAHSGFNVFRTISV